MSYCRGAGCAGWTPRSRPQTDRKGEQGPKLPLFFLILQGALPALCLFLFLGCSPSATPRQWEIEETLTANPRFNGGRLILGPDGEFSHLELELFRTRSGLRLYLNLLFLCAEGLPDRPRFTPLQICFEDEEPWDVEACLLEGEQRLLIPGGIADHLICALLENKTFTLSVGRHRLVVIPNRFSALYTQLLSLSIEQPPP